MPVEEAVSQSCDLVLTLWVLSFMPVGDGTKTLEEWEESLTMFVMWGGGSPKHPRASMSQFGCNVVTSTRFKKWTKNVLFGCLLSFLIMTGLWWFRNIFWRKIFAQVDDITQKFGEPLGISLLNILGRIEKTFPIFFFFAAFSYIVFN